MLTSLQKTVRCKRFLMLATLALTSLATGQAPDPGGLAIQVLATAAVFWPAWRLIAAYEDADVRFK